MKSAYSEGQKTQKLDPYLLAKHYPPNLQLLNLSILNAILSIDFMADYPIARSKAFKAPIDSKFMHIDEQQYLASNNKLDFVNHASKITPEAVSGHLK